MLRPSGFSELLTFPSVFGNQEERILLLTETDEPLRKKIADLPELISLQNARVIHGHQWSWGGSPWSLLQAETTHTPTFYGHSHTSGLTCNGNPQPIELFTPYKLMGEDVLVNVGSVIDNREWVLFDVIEGTVRFMKAE